MSERSSAGQALIGIFTEALTLFGVPGEPSHMHALAIAAFSDIVDRAHASAMQAGQQTVMFADHGPEHHRRLGAFALKMLRAWKQNVPAGSPISDPKCLLLTFSAFVLHDIGMGVRTRDVLVGDPSLRRTQIQRRDHDTRSLDYIERNLIRPLRAGGNPFTTNWAAFWQSQVTEDWPQQAPYWAAILLARICQTHGDPSEIWLRETSIHEYRFVSDGEFSGDPISLKDYWGDLWQGEISPIAMAAATVLCLCDLSDMGEGRFVKPPDEWELDEQPSTHEAARRSWLHWAAHQLVKTQVTERKIVVKVARAGNPLAVLPLPIVAGPVPALLHWGRQPQITQNIRSYLNPRFDGLDVQPGSSQDDSWHQVESKLTDRKHREVWFSRGGSRAGDESTEPFDFTAQVLNPRWWDEGFDRGSWQFWEGRLGALSPVRMALQARDAGVPYEDFFSLDAPPPKANSFVVIGKAAGIAGERYCDQFFAALKVARSLIFASPEKYWRAAICAKGLSIYDVFSKSRGSVDDYGGNILLCPTTSINDIDQYRRIQEAASHERNLLVIFFGDAECADELSIGGSYPISVRLDTRLMLSTLGELQHLVDDTTVYEYLVSGAGSVSFLEERILSYIDKVDGPEPRDALGLFIVIICLDALDWASTGHIPRSELKKIYAAVAGSLAPYSICELDAALAVLMRRADTLSAHDDALQLQSGFADLILQREILEARSRKLRLLSVLTISLLDNNAILRNLRQSFRSVWAIPQATLGVARDVLSDREEPFRQRVALGLWLADCIGWETSRGLRKPPEALSSIRSSLMTPQMLEPPEFVLRQQMAYRFAVQSLPHLADMSRNWRTGPPEFALGVLEGIASSEIPEGSLRAKLEDVANSIFEQAADGVTDGEEGELLAAIAFDILYKYGGDNPTLLRAGANLQLLADARGWGAVAAHFHGGAPLSSAQLSERLIGRWRQYRQTLLNFLSDYMPADFRRRATSTAAMERVKEA